MDNELVRKHNKLVEYNNAIQVENERLWEIKKMHESTNEVKI